MNTVILAICLATLGMPGAGDGKTTPPGMTSQPLPDDTLEKGTVSVLVRGGKVAGLEVYLLPAGASGAAAGDKALAATQTNAEGRAFLKASAHGGQEVRVVVKTAAGLKRSVPFTVPLLGGVRLLFTGDAKADPHAATAPADDPHAGHNHGPGEHGKPAVAKGPATQDPKDLRLWMSFRLIAIEGGDLYLGVTYTLLNRGTATFSPGSHGLMLPVPQGAKNVSLARGSRGAKAVKQGIRVTRSVATGRHGFQVTANVKFKVDRPTVDVRIGSPIPLIGYSASLKAYPGVRIKGAGLAPPETMDTHAEHGGNQLVYRSVKEGFPRTTLAFQITGIPVRSRARSWPFALVALLLLLGGIVLAVLHARRAERRAPEAAAGASDDPVEALLRLERDRRLGLLSEDKLATERQRVLDAVSPQGAKTR